MAVVIDRNATGRQLGAYKSAAKKTGCTLVEWMALREAGKHWCFRCRTWLPVTDFTIDRARKGGLAPRCRTCTTTASRASMYGTTYRELASYIADHDGKCPICGRRRKLVIDHCHDKGHIRGLLCNRCNVGLGQFKDDPKLLSAALAYLERTKDGREHQN